MKARINKTSRYDGQNSLSLGIALTTFTFCQIGAAQYGHP